jgi:hypothetical protein
VTSIKEVEALVHDLRQQQQDPVNRDKTTSAHTPVWGDSIDPPPTPVRTASICLEARTPLFEGRHLSPLAIVLPVTRTPHRTPVLTRTTTLWVALLRPRHLHLCPRGLSVGIHWPSTWHLSVEGIPPLTVPMSSLLLQAVLVLKLMVWMYSSWGGQSHRHNINK